jgi:hypothetical protein
MADVRPIVPASNGRAVQRERIPSQYGLNAQNCIPARDCPFYRTPARPRAGTLAIQIEIGYNTTMVALQFIVVAALISVLYVYLRQSNQD